VFTQAAIHDLYNPERRGVCREWQDDELRRVRKISADLRGKMQADGGAGLAFLVEETHSPTRSDCAVNSRKMFPKIGGAFTIRC